jgi:hypothetical protein
MPTLIAQAKKGDALQAIDIPPEWVDDAAILTGYAGKYVTMDYTNGKQAVNGCEAISWGW